MAIVVAAQVIVPSFIAPLFNRFEELKDAALRARVEALMARAGFAARGLFVMDGSRRSAHANAYFTGFGSAKRVVFFDTLLSRLAAGEVGRCSPTTGPLQVAPHSQAHGRDGGDHAAFFALLGWLDAGSTAARRRPNLTLPNDALALVPLPLVSSVFGVFAPPSSPAGRAATVRADARLDPRGRPRPGVGAAQAAPGQRRDADPDPVYARFYYSHPPAVSDSPRSAAPQNLPS
jgi:STE24 endopeptidase